MNDTINFKNYTTLHPKHSVYYRWTGNVLSFGIGVFVFILLVVALLYAGGGKI